MDEKPDHLDLNDQLSAIELEFLEAVISCFSKSKGDEFILVREITNWISQQSSNSIERYNQITDNIAEALKNNLFLDEFQRRKVLIHSKVGIVSEADRDKVRATLQKNVELAKLRYSLQNKRIFLKRVE